ncbi:hypothetical protein HMPREF0492_0456 [Lactobacillus acidophilus ATCC 4796]|uniref:Uncharacterized protein n=2 Tax=Lactobacillus TaxID=1578 RepID=Q5FMT3_LACAC|nr:hypothetical protein LBA0089 [Lactobacillus acidophilus NCFM]ASN46033.1 hypothetical protein CGZ81_02035 [Lactobacillus acidophilus]EEJ76656.1 hypothetical protein HMPREF0492_0456 [Lactobacillus acidophilus ATCC 4796]AVW87748.1 hypothetical protein LA20079_08490 [Lactobacillus acidophilus]AZN75744.1 hypothetical protein CXB72_00565 [Lactobacillus acidophilus]
MEVDNYKKEILIMKKVILSLVLVLSLGLASNLTVSKASATTYSTNRYIHRLPGAGVGQHEIQD